MLVIRFAWITRRAVAVSADAKSSLATRPLIDHKSGGARLEAERQNLNWRGAFHQHGINAVFLEAYWNEGSPVDQARWIDNFVISTKPIGPVVCPRNPVLIKTPYRGPGSQQAWQVELAADDTGDQIVWQSNPITNAERLRVGTDTGKFTRSLETTEQLDRDSVYYCRVRQQSDNGQWSDWSPWHQPFQTE